ncbi:MAG: hypothetical protein QOG10_3003 [Kribbellaceae bacterium]|nr:hypothetical protein [Kribbellaceae bacterium]
MLRQLFAAAAAVVLLAGCSGGDNQSDSQSGDGGKSSASTPPTPAVASFDPPKAFTAVSAIGQPKGPGLSAFNIKAGMVGPAAVFVSPNGISGWNVAGQAAPWNIPAQDVPTTTTASATDPMAVQLNGKEVIAVAFDQRAQGSGTQKARHQINFQWIDPVEGKSLAQVIVDLTPALGPDQGGNRITSQVFDAATGQVAISMSPASDALAKKAGSFTVYADPTTKKGTVVPFLRAGGLLNGVLTGVKGTNQEGSKDLSIALVDAVSGTVKKNTPIAMDYLDTLGSGPKHAYVYGDRYVSAPPGKIEGHYNNSLYSVDLTSGALQEAKGKPVPDDNTSYACWSDQASAFVCNGKSANETVEIFGMDDKTGKKAWGYTKQSSSRVVPEITTAFHGLVYVQAETIPVLLDATTGQDVPTPSPTPAGGATPTGGATSTDGSSPTDGSTPTDGTSPTAGSSSSPGAGSGDGSGLSLYDGTRMSPVMVSQYGGAHLQEPGQYDFGNETILVVLKATA